MIVGSADGSGRWYNVQGQWLVHYMVNGWYNLHGQWLVQLTWSMVGTTYLVNGWYNPHDEVQNG